MFLIRSLILSREVFYEQRLQKTEPYRRQTCEKGFCERDPSLWEIR